MFRTKGLDNLPSLCLAQERGKGTHTLSPWMNSSGRSFSKFFLIQTRRFRMSPREGGTEQTKVKANSFPGPKALPSSQGQKPD